MAVGHEVAQLTGLKLFHNHHAIDLALRFFPFGTPPFHRLVGTFRRRIFEEVAASDLPGMVFTYVWAFDLASDDATVEEYSAIFRARGAQICFVELECDLAERQRRNETEFRLAEKPFKRDLEQSRRNLAELDAKYQLNSKGKFDARADYLRLDNTALPAVDVAEKIVAHFGLRRVPTSPARTGT
jgi:hypothetical protein